MNMAVAIKMTQTGSRSSNLYHTPLFNLDDWLDFQDDRYYIWQKKFSTIKRNYHIKI